MTRLYKLDNNKRIRTWKVDIVEDEGYEVSHGLLGGEQQYKFTDVYEGKVNRDVDEQIELEVNSLIKKKKDRGYVDSVARAKEGVTNQLGLPLPMLGKPFKDVTVDWNEEHFVQYKYNGHRCLITRKDGELLAYSKSGLPIKSIPHIFKDLAWLPEGRILDGELYHHGTKINTISSWVRRPQENSTKLIYVVYDTLEDAPYTARLHFLQQNLRALGRTAWAPTQRSFLTANCLSPMLKAALEAGYEGLMIRTLYSTYESGKRSKNLVKVKQWITEEFPVVDITESKDGWAILTCVVHTKNDTEIVVDVSAPGTHAEKTEVLRNKENYLGRMVQLQFAEYTEFGVPFHPVAIYWRDPE